jgi:hypothetical protein
MERIPMTVEIRLASGEAITVEGDLEEVEKELSDAARSGQSRLAWFVQGTGGARIAINPAHVASLRASTSRAD